MQQTVPRFIFIDIKKFGQKSTVRFEKKAGLGAMADEYHQLGSGNWWNNNNSTPRDGFDGAGTTPLPSPSISTTLNAVSSYGWPAEMVDMVQSRPSSMDSTAVSGVLANPELQMMGLGLSSQSMNWDQALLEGKGCDQSTLRSLLQEDLNSNSSSFQHESASNSSSQEHWREGNEFKRINHGFLSDQPQFSSNDSTMLTSQNLSTGFQALLLSENQQQAMSYPYASSSDGYGAAAAESNRFLQFLRASPPQDLPFSDNAASWNATSAKVADARLSFFPDSQRQRPSAPSFDEKPKNMPEVRDSVATTKKTRTETSNKRPRSETTSPLPAAFKVKKEKMGDRITALQQLVSPFGKTDTASVLSEVIENIKFLHQQISVLSTPYMKDGAPIQHQQSQNSNKSKVDPEGPQQDLGSRGLCLVPVSSTFPMTHETSVDFWTPTFGGTFR